MNVSEPMRPNAALQLHEDAVPALSWNLLQRTMLLSASIDRRAAIWTLDTCQPVAVFDVGSPCKAAEWNPAHDSVFGIASEAGCAFYEARQPHALFTVCEGIQIETLVWLSENQVAIGNFSGEIVVVDQRQPTEPVGRVAAHPSAVTSLSVCRAAPILASTGEDGCCRLWNVKEAAPVLVAEEHMNDGRLYASAFSPDRATLLAAGGDGDDVQLWDIANLLEQ